MNDERLLIDFSSLCSNLGIKVAQSGERHYREGWVCLPCPFCTGQEGNHLGFQPESNVFTCFRCGRHGKYETIAALLGVSKKEAYETAKKYSRDTWTTLSLQIHKNKTERQRETTKARERFENENGAMRLPGKRTPSEIHKRYIASRRGFSIQSLISDWDIRFSGTCGRYSYRIIIPITYRNKIVSFTSRDVTGQAQDRYLTPSVEECIRHPKFCVYGKDQSPFLKTCVVVEGPFGVWRIGKGCVGTCGTGWTDEQAKIIARYHKSYVLFDPEEREALIRANNLANMLSAYRDHKSFVVEGKGSEGRDTGELTKEEVREIRKLLK